MKDPITVTVTVTITITITITITVTVTVTVTITVTVTVTLKALMVSTGHTADHFRLFCLSHHYSSDIEYSMDRMMDAKVDC